MTELLQVETLGVDRSTVIARTILQLDGSVVMALRPDVLHEPELLARHTSEVNRRLRLQLGRLRSVAQAIVLVRRVGTGLLVISSAVSSYELLAGTTSGAIRWAATAAGVAMARWLLPMLLRVLTRRWLRELATRSGK